MKIFLLRIKPAFAALFVLTFFILEPAWGTTILYFGDTSTTRKYDTVIDGLILPDVLDATLSINVTGSTLTLIISNLTSVGTGYKIQGVYLNASGNVTGVSAGDISSKPLTSFSFSPDKVNANGIGTFDLGLSATGNKGIDPGQSATYTMSITGTGSYQDSDFTTQYSQPRGSYIPFLAAVNFKGLTGSKPTVYAGIVPYTQAIIPEPSSILLLGSGLIGLMGLCRRR
ncbi:MAG: PEP-CTERM sorting domain-containing protein [bacterium]